MTSPENVLFKVQASTKRIFWGRDAPVDLFIVVERQRTVSTNSDFGVMGLLAVGLALLADCRIFHSFLLL